MRQRCFRARRRAPSRSGRETGVVRRLPERTVVTGRGTGLPTCTSYSTVGGWWRTPRRAPRTQRSEIRRGRAIGRSTRCSPNNIRCDHAGRSMRDLYYGEEGGGGRGVRGRIRHRRHLAVHVRMQRRSGSFPSCPPPPTRPRTTGYSTVWPRFGLVSDGARQLGTVPYCVPHTITALDRVWRFPFFLINFCRAGGRR